METTGQTRTKIVYTDRYKYVYPPAYDGDPGEVIMTVGEIMRADYPRWADRVRERNLIPLTKENDWGMSIFLDEWITIHWAWKVN